MSIWGKLIGGAAGMALGGPIGAILGIAAGHGVDRVRRLDNIESNQQIPKSIPSPFYCQFCSMVYHPRRIQNLFYLTSR